MFNLGSVLTTGAQQLVKFPDEETVRSSLYKDREGLQPELYRLIPRFNGVEFRNGYMYRVEINKDPLTLQEREEALRPVVNLAAKRVANKQFNASAVATVAAQVLYDIDDYKDGITGEKIEGFKHPLDSYDLGTVIIDLTGALRRIAIPVEPTN